VSWHNLDRRFPATAPPYFDQKERPGFDYAYRYPGMQPVLQAVGSVATFRFCGKTRFRDFAEKPVVDCEALRQGFSSKNWIFRKNQIFATLPKNRRTDVLEHLNEQDAFGTGSFL
jgi:hypothetical protein